MHAKLIRDMSESSILAPLEIKAIMDHIPHRYPILLVDRVIEIDPGKYCKALKNVSMMEPYFQGHYPEDPIMPGVLIIEAMAQTSSLMLLVLPKFQNCVPLLASIHDAKFKKRVIPGDQLIIETYLAWFRNDVGRVKGTVTVDGVIVATCEINCVLKPKTDL